MACPPVLADFADVTNSLKIRGDFGGISGGEYRDGAKNGVKIAVNGAETALTSALKSQQLPAG
jgi:hypothetical protein